MDDDWPKTGEFLSTLAKSRRLAIALSHARLLARRAAEVGFHRALIARDQLPGAAAEDCRAVGRLAANAANALDAYTENLSPTSREPHALELPLVSLLGTGPVTFEMGVPLIGGLTVQQCHAKAREDASVLLQAARVLACYGGAASAMRERIRKDRRNPGKPDEVAFFLPLAEAWICITGRPPGRSKSTNEGKHPCIRFAQAAWADVFDPEDRLDKPKFVGALEQLRTWNSEQLQVLRSRGPDWL